MEVADGIKTENKHFPDLRTYVFPQWFELGGSYYDARDIVSLGVPLSVESLTEAYRKGIFPWEMGDDVPLPWYCPQKRAILEFADLKLPRSLRREWERNPFTFTIDQAFPQVIENCSQVTRKGQRGTWITPAFISNFTKLHEAGMAHSVEAWDGEELIAGLYGVDCGGVFCGESMFHLRSNASKFAVLFLAGHLKERGASWLDIEVMTPHFKMLGAKEIKRSEFIGKLADTQEMNLKLF